MQREFLLNLAIACALNLAAHGQSPGPGASPASGGQATGGRPGPGGR